MGKKEKIGTIGWIDLTVKDAVQIKEFYSRVTGWKPSGVSMGGYEDFNMIPPSHETPVSGICHARGQNAHLPPQWLIYIYVENLDESIKNCLQLGGKLIGAVKDMGSQGRFCVISDPAGAMTALFEPAE